MSPGVGGVCIALSFALGALAAPAFGQAAPAYQAHRTPDGHPDLQGVWSIATATPVERPAGYPLVITRAQADKIEGGTLFNRRIKSEASYVAPTEGAPEKGKPLPPVGNYDVAYTDPGSRVTSIGGELRSSWIVYPENGRMPELTAEGRAARDVSVKRKGSGYDNPEERGLGERCVLLSGGPPFRSGLYNNNIQIVQTPTEIAMMVEMVHDTRFMHINGQHRPDGLEQWMGDSIAHWDGDTLVVETTHLNWQQRSERTQLSPDAKVTERFKRISDRQILYQFEVNDPKTYKDVWRGETALNLLNEPMFEYACHEGNYGLQNILKGGRQNDRLRRANKDSGARSE